MLLSTLLLTPWAKCLCAFGSQDAKKHCKEQLALDKGVVCGQLEQAGSLDLGNVLEAAGLLIVCISILYAVRLRCSSTTSERAGVTNCYRSLFTEQALCVMSECILGQAAGDAAPPCMSAHGQCASLCSSQRCGASSRPANA